MNRRPGTTRNTPSQPVTAEHPAPGRTFVLSNGLLEDIVNSANFGLVAADMQGRVIFINTFARMVLNIDLDVNATTLFVKDFDPDLWDAYREIIASGNPQFNVPVQYQDNQLVSHRMPILRNNSIIGAMSIFKYLEAYERITGRSL